MSYDINRMTVSGNLTRDAELKYFRDGTPTVRLSIAVSRSVKKGDVWESVPMFFEIQKTGAGVDKMHADLTKGRNISVDGYLRQDKWNDDQGNAKSKIYIVAEKLVLGRSPRNHPGSESQAESGYNPGNLTGQALKDYQEQHMDSKPDFEDDVPF